MVFDRSCLQKYKETNSVHYSRVFLALKSLELNPIYIFNENREIEMTKSVMWY